MTLTIWTRGAQCHSPSSSTTYTCTNNHLIILNFEEDLKSIPPSSIPSSHQNHVVIQWIDQRKKGGKLLTFRRHKCKGDPTHSRAWITQGYFIKYNWAMKIGLQGFLINVILQVVY
jgi:hypothetical protein